MQTINIKIYRTISLPIVLFGSETLSHIEGGAWAEGVRVQRGICVPKRDEVREWRKLRNEELNDLYSSPNSHAVMKVRVP